MKRVQKVMLGVAAFTALGLGGSLAAYAEPYGMMGAEGCAYEQGGQYPMRAKKGKAPADFAAAATARLDKLKTELKITAEQDGAWQNFADKARQQVENMQAMRDMAPASTTSAAAATTAAALPAPERMEKRIEFMKQRLASMETVHTALKALYTTLTPEQKALADKHFTHHQAQHRHERMGRGR